MYIPDWALLLAIIFIGGAFAHLEKEITLAKKDINQNAKDIGILNDKVFQEIDDDIEN